MEVSIYENSKTEIKVRFKEVNEEGWWRHSQQSGLYVLFVYETGDGRIVPSVIYSNRTLEKLSDDGIKNWRDIFLIKDNGFSIIV